MLNKLSGDTKVQLAIAAASALFILAASVTSYRVSQTHFESTVNAREAAIMKEVERHSNQIAGLEDHVNDLRPTIARIETRIIYIEDETKKIGEKFDRYLFAKGRK